VNLKSIKKSIKLRNKQISKTFAQVEETLADHIHSDVKIYFDKVNTHQIHFDEKTPDGETRHIQSGEQDHSFRELVEAHIKNPQTNTLNQLTNSLYNLWSESFKKAAPASVETDKAAELAQDIMADVAKAPESNGVTAEQAEALNQALKTKTNYSAEWSEADKAIEVFYNPPKKDRQLLATVAADQSVTYTDALSTKRVMKKEVPDMIAAVLA
jgi:deoxyadenosine/deoxycytidine kinase